MKERRRSAPRPAELRLVAIGASAGGLEALELFLKEVQPDSGVAFVVVQHLDPTRKGMLVELLARVAPIPVIEAEDGMPVQADRVYVIPANKDLFILHGVLQLLEPVQPRGQRLPIDGFFRSVADDLGARSIGVLLSGMGSDGTLGARAIREKAGGVFAQEPASARFDGMPRSAIDSGVVDVIAPAEHLPARIIDYIQHSNRFVHRALAEPDAKSGSALEKIIAVLRSATGHDFSPYKSSTLHRRIERRMALHQLADVAHYLRYLRENPAEADLLFKEVLIGVTTFFRDAEVWGFIKTRLFAELISAIPNNTVLRAWVPACSTGEEAYSLGICFREALRESGTSKQIALQIFATDLDKAAVEKARQATYPASIASQVAPELLERYFSSEGEHRYRVRQEVRELVVFATQNVLQDPPFTKLDLLSCRNLLIYLTAETQRKVLPLFHYSLKPGGALVLGSAETIGGFHELFRPRDGALRIYRRLETSAGMSPIDFPTHRLRPPGQGKEPMTVTTPAGPDANQPNLQAQVEAILVRRFSPAAVLVGRAGDILFVSGRTNSYLEVPAGKTNWNLLAMAREGLRQAFEGVLERVAQSGRAMALKGVEVGSDGGARTVDVTIEPLDEPRGLRGTLLVVFNEVAPPPAPTRSGRPAGARGEQVARLEKQLSRATSELRATRDEAQTAQEELKSANEELQSTNEELQSANEELTTSKEEIQSMNEELQTLNAELQAKVDDLSRTSNDMRNLLDSTAIAVLFLDEALSVRRFTPQAATLIKLIAGDIGRPLADLATTLEYPALYDDAREVLRTLAFKETTVRTHDGQKVGVRIMPYRTSENRIDGVVITFVSMPGGALPVTPKRSESR